MRAPDVPPETLDVLARGDSSPEAARPPTRGALALRVNHLLGRERNWVSGARPGVGGGWSVPAGKEGDGSGRRGICIAYIF